MKADQIRSRQRSRLSKDFGWIIAYKSITIEIIPLVAFRHDANLF